MFCEVSWATGYELETEIRNREQDFKSEHEKMRFIQDFEMDLAKCVIPSWWELPAI